MTTPASPPKFDPKTDPRVLIVDDEPRMRELLSRAVGGWGFDVTTAKSGEEALRLAAEHASGTVTWMTGPATLADHTVPTINAAAADLGMPAPRIVGALPVAVTDDPDALRAKAAKVFQVYGMLPSYRAMLDREGAAGPADVALVGSADVVRAGIERMFEAGTTEFVAVPYSNRDETLEVLQGLL